MKKCYYKSLEVDQDAAHEEIKASFRRLSKETHPDVAQKGCPKKNSERFKEISEAHAILSNAKERRRYDLELQDRQWYMNRRPGSGPDRVHRPHPQGPKATGFYGVLETCFRPRNFAMGITFGICSIYAYQSFLGDDKKKQLLMRHQGNQLVEAWKNPKTGRWEQAAPWDPTFRRLKPTLEMVPREQVQSRTR